jgi:NAD(P) transhydrogenase subunit alpha
VVNVNMEDDAIRGLTVIKDGGITWPPPPLKLPAAPVAAKPVAPPPKPKGHGEPSGPMSPTKMAVLFGVGALLFALIGAYAPASFLGHFTVFVLACFVGYMVVWNVTPALHTPLMSVTNAISSIIVIGALMQISSETELIRWIAVATVGITAVNIFGGFAVTRRMLEMFRK